MREYHQARAQAQRDSYVSERHECAAEGCASEVGNPRAKYCPSCRQKGRYARGYREPGSSRPCSECGTLMDARQAAERPVCRSCRRKQWRTATCEQCGKEFSRPRYKGDVFRYCSSKCYLRVHTVHTAEERKEREKERKKAMTRARKMRRRMTWDGVSDAQVFERDGWRCQICQWLVFRDEEYPHPASASIDHIVPLSRGGSDVAANKRTAHLFCNIRRGNKITPEEKELAASTELAPFGVVPARRAPKCPVHAQSLPWPRNVYWVPCRWCEKEVPKTRTLRAQVTVCSECCHGKCSSCGGYMWIVVNSRPPETRLCHECRAACRGAESPGTREARYAEARLWWTSVRPPGREVS